MASSTVVGAASVDDDDDDDDDDVDVDDEASVDAAANMGAHNNTNEFTPECNTMRKGQSSIDYVRSMMRQASKRHRQTVKYRNSIRSDE
jgi:hypothetical protein